MKLEFSQEIIRKLNKRLLHLVPNILIVVFIFLFVFLTYMAIRPVEDSVARADGDKKINSLKINLNQKTFLELNKDPAPGVAAGSRNPFSN